METSSHALTRLLPLLAKLGQELGRIGQDGSPGLVPVQYFLTRIEENVAALHPPKAVVKAVKLARTWLEQSFAGEIPDARLSMRFQVWLNWMEKAVAAAEAGQPLPAWPEELGDADKPAWFGQLRAEARELLEQLLLNTLAWGAQPEPGALLALERSLHTFKAVAGSLGLRCAATVAHELESLLGRTAGKPARETILPLLMDAHSALQGVLDQHDRARGGALDLPETLKAQVNQLQTRIQAAGHSVDKERSRSGGDSACETPSCGENCTRQRKGVRPGESAIRELPAFVRVEAGRWEVFQQLFDRWRQTNAHRGEPTEVYSDAAGAALPPPQQQARFRGAAGFHELCRELEAAVIALRCVSLAGCFWKLRWLVEGLAPALGKLARLETEGEELELDVETAATLETVLLHLVRNALDHGVETPDARRAAGKSETGTIRVSAQSFPGVLVVEVCDDGAGLDAQKILAQAAAKGLRDSGAPADHQELLDLLTRQGFSTVGSPNEISGRGLGLNIVRQAVEQLGGRLEIDPGSGPGVAFRLCLRQAHASWAAPATKSRTSGSRPVSRPPEHAQLIPERPAHAGLAYGRS